MMKGRIQEAWAYSPAPFIDKKIKNEIIERIIKPTLNGMRNEGCPYSGILYLGLMLTTKGPSVIEYNIRLGDPEAQVILPLLKTDFMDIVKAVINKKIDQLNIKYYNGCCTGVVMASNGYPDRYKKGFEVTGKLSDENGLYVFHAGTRLSKDGLLVTDGGRILCVSAIGKTLRESIDSAYLKVREIKFEGAHFRKDIGKKGLKFIGE